MGVRKIGQPRISLFEALGGGQAGSAVLIPAGILLGCLIVVLSGCARVDTEMADQLVQMEGEGEVSEQRIEQIKGEIRRFRKEVDRTVAAAGQLGVYYKMLALEYLRGGMYGEAYDALQQAIAIHPENAILYYYSGAAAARMSKAQVIGEDRRMWLDRAEALYRRALDLDPGYAAALYGLSVVYVFELERPQEAEGLLERLLRLESKEINGRFLLARVYYSLGKLENAIEVYREIESLSDLEENRRDAAESREQIEGELYGAQ